MTGTVALLDGFWTLLDVMVEHAPDAVVGMDAKGDIRGWNPQAENMLGWTRAEVLGRPLAIIIPPRYRDAHRRGLARYISTGQGPLLGRRLEIEALHHDGHELAVELTVTPIAMAGGVQFVAFVRDLTERRELDRKLAEVNRLAATGTLAAGIVHEINNPLTTVLLHLGAARHKAEQLAAASGLAGSLVSDLVQIRESIETVRDIAHDLRALSRGTTEASGSADVRAALRTAVAITAPQLRRRARVEQHYAPVPAVRGSEARLAQVFVNLLLNAADALAEGDAERGRVTIDVGPTPDGRVCVAVGDTGQGISADSVDRVFDAFYSTKSSESSSGLGLWVSRGIVEGFGGELTVDSEPGAGATFRVVLPAA